MPRKLPFGLTDALAAPFANIATHSTLELHIPQGRRPARSLYLATAGITYQGVTYTGTLKGFSAIRHSLNRAADEVQLSIRNEELGQGVEFLFYLDALNGAEAKVGRYWWQDANKEFHKVLLVGRASITDITDTEVKLKIVSDFYSNVNVGATRSLTRECGFKFRDSQTCGYSGAELKCNKLLNSADGCLGRHGDPLHRAKFGGFAYIDTATTVSGAAALAAPASNQLVKTTSDTFAQRSAIQFVGATVTDDPVNNLTKVDYSATSLTSAPWIYVDAYGAVGDGATDDRTAIQAALDAVPSAGGMVVFSAKTYYVTGALNIKSNTTVMGMGYSTVLTCPSAGWALSAPTNFGILNITQKSNIRITNLRIVGTKSQSNINNVPKLIYMERYDTVKIDRCWFENSNAEGIWQGCTGCSYPTFNVTNIGITITDCEFYDIGYTGVTGFYDLTAIQLNGQYCNITANRFEKVGTAVAGSGYHLVIANNTVYDVYGAGIGVGDSDPIGDVTITGNVIDLTESSILGRKGILCGHNNSGNTDYPINVVGNTIRVVGTGSGSVARGIYIPSCQHANISDNVIEITYRGIGLEVDTAGVVGGVSIVNLSNNVVRSVSESAASYGFAATIGSGTTLKMLSSNNRVYGQTRAGGSYPYFYQTGSGTNRITMSGDWTEEGNIRVGSTTYSSSQYDKIPLYFQADANIPALTTPGFVRVGTSLGLGITGIPAYTIDTGLTSTSMARVGKTLTGAWDGVDGAYTFFQNGSLSVAAGNYSIAQSSSGQTLLNSASGQSLNIRINNSDAVNIDSSRNVTIVGPTLRLTEQASSPGTPASGTYAIYAKTDNKFYGKNDAGTEFEFPTIDGSTATITVGKTYTGTWTGIDTGYFFLQNSSLSIAAGNYAIAQNASGATSVNSASGQSLVFAINNSAGLTMDSSRNLTFAGTLVRLSGTSSSFPALKRNGTIIESRLADDSGYADLRVRQPYVDATMTAGGTTGNQTINKAAGSVNFAAGASSLTVTNSLCTTSSIVICTILTNDTTAVIKNVVPGSGSFVITLNAAATSETKCGFLVINQ